MMKRLKISEKLSLPLEVVTQAIGILAKRRAGKSYAMRRIAEQLLKTGQQVVIVDPKGDQWGIRSASDGISPGLPVVILGGERADVPLEVNSGEVVAKLVVEDRVSVLLDLSLFRKHEVATFMSAFLENLYRLKAREIYRTPMMLVIDEADAIAPQKPQKGEERMLGAAEDIVRRGGQRGIGCTLITQRSAVLNKNVLTQIQILIVLRTIAPQDLAAIDAWIDVHGTDEERKLLKGSLPSLPQGDAWVWSPGWPTAEGIFERVHVSPIETFDSGATPKPGEKRIEPKNLADVDLDVLKKQMAATIEKAKAENPKELQEKVAEGKKQIAELERKLAQAGTAKPATETIKTIDKPVLKDGQLTRLEKVVGSLSAVVTKHAEIGTVLVGIAREIQESIAKVNANGHKPAEVIRVTTPRPIPAAQPRQQLQPKREASSDVANITGGALRILQVLAAKPEVRLTKPQLGTLARMKHTGGSFGTYMSRLRSARFLTDDGKYVVITDAGIDFVGTDRLPEPLSSEEVLQQWLNTPAISGGAANMLTTLFNLRREGRGLSRTELGEAVNMEPTGGSFGTYLSRLRSNGLIQEESGVIYASDTLFINE